MARIAVGGWHHETNTFAPIKADFAAFEAAGSWPGLTRGTALFADVDGINLPMTSLPVPSLTTKDRKDLRHSLRPRPVADRHGARNGGLILRPRAARGLQIR